MKKITRDERGVASIIISIAIVIIVSLVVIGFATIMRRESRQALDQQLSSQAYYAAEAQLNEKVAELQENPTSVTPVNTCSPEDAFTTNSEIRSTCVLVNPTPDSLEYDEVRTDASTVVLLTPTAPISSLLISWEDKDGGGSCYGGAYTNLPTGRGATDIGFLRADLTRIPGSNFDRNSLVGNTMSGVLYPKSSGGSRDAAFNSADSPKVFGDCGGFAVTPAPYTAKARFTFSSPTSDQFLLRMRGVYKSSRVRVVGLNASNQAITFEGAQIVVDSTAKVNDVVRRVQARVPVSVTPGAFADYAVRSTDSICKLLQTEPTSATHIEACP